MKLFKIKKRKEVNRESLPTSDCVWEMKNVIRALEHDIKEKQRCDDGFPPNEALAQMHNEIMRIAATYANYHRLDQLDDSPRDRVQLVAFAPAMGRENRGELQFQIDDIDPQYTPKAGGV